MLLSKGFEIEMYTGTPAGEVVGLSDRIVAALNGFVREPDSRNVEYTTPPLCQYEKLLCELVRPPVCRCSSEKAAQSGWRVRSTWGQ